MKTSVESVGAVEAREATSALLGAIARSGIGLIADDGFTSAVWTVGLAGPFLWSEQLAAVMARQLSAVMLSNEVKCDFMTGNWKPILGMNMRLSSWFSPERTGEKGDDEKDEENVEKDPGDVAGGASNAGESEESGDDCDDEEGKYPA